MEQRLTLITLGAENVHELSRFYQEIFDWKPLPNSNDDITFFQLNGIQLAIFGRKALADDANISESGSGFKGFSLAYNIGSEEEVNNLFSELQSKGVKILKKPEKVHWGGYSGYISDPENNVWEIAYNPYMKFDDSGNVIA